MPAGVCTSTVVTLARWSSFLPLYVSVWKMMSSLCAREGRGQMLLGSILTDILPCLSLVPVLAMINIFSCLQGRLYHGTFAAAVMVALRSGYCTLQKPLVGAHAVPASMQACL